MYVYGPSNGYGHCVEHSAGSVAFVLKKLISIQKSRARKSYKILPFVTSLSSIPSFAFELEAIELIESSSDFVFMSKEFNSRRLSTI